MIRNLFASMIMFSLTACVGPFDLSGTVVDFNPPELRKPKIEEVKLGSKYVDYLDEVAGDYVNAAAGYANAAQAPDLVVLGAATTAAIAATFGWHLDIVKAAGLTAAGAYSIKEYYGVDRRVTSLVNGTTGLSCLRTLAAGAEALDIWPQASLEINKGVDRIRHNVLLASLSGRAVDYNALVTVMTAQAKQAAAFSAGSDDTKARLNASAAAANTSQKQTFIAELPAEVTGCVATSVQS